MALGCGAAAIALVAATGKVKKADVAGDVGGHCNYQFMHPQRQIHLGLGEPLLADHLDDIGFISLAPNLARDDLDMQMLKQSLMVMKLLRWN